MRRLTRLGLLVALAGSMLAAGLAPASAQQSDNFGREDRGGRNDRDRYRRADPSKVVATELAFARLAQEKGQWTAFSQFAADNAVMFVPEPVNAKEWLKKQQNPAQTVKWQPHQVWSSCDGTLAVTKGAWQRPDGSVGYFTTAWERQRNGEYKWVMDQGDVLEQPLESQEMIGGIAADCATRAAPPPAMQAEPTDRISSGAARDGSLRWYVVSRPDGSRDVATSYWNGTDWVDAIRVKVAAGG